MGYEESIDLLEAVEREAAGLFTQAALLVETLAARAGLDVAGFRCLCALGRQGPLPVHALAEAAGVDVRAAEDLVDRLERDGHATRRAEPGGTRVLVHPNPVARRARVEPALRDLREAWYPLTRRSRDDLALVAGLLAESRRLTDLVALMRN